MEELDQCSVVLRDKMKQCRPPVHLSVLMRAYRMDLGKEVPFEQYGYSNPADFLRENFSELTLVKCDRTPGGYVVHLRDQTHESDSPSNDAPTSSGNLLPPPATSLTTLNPKQWIKKKTVPVQFKTFLTRILKNYPQGISARDFVDVFYKISGSPLSYKLYGYPGHLSMFKDLPDVFRIEEQSDNEHKLFPLESSDAKPITDSELRSRFEALRTATNGEENRHQSPSCFRAINSPVLDSRDTVPVRQWGTPYGTLITVNLDGNVLVSTGCLAFMIGMSTDDILLRLKHQGIDIRGVKFLTNDIPDHMILLEKLADFKCPLLTLEDGRPVCVISLVPFESCSFILSAFSKMSVKMQRQLEEIREIYATLDTP